MTQKHGDLFKMELKLQIQKQAMLALHESIITMALHRIWMPIKVEVYQRVEQNLK